MSNDNFEKLSQRVLDAMGKASAGVSFADLRAALDTLNDPPPDLLYPSPRRPFRQPPQRPFDFSFGAHELRTDLPPLLEQEFRKEMVIMPAPPADELVQASERIAAQIAEMSLETSVSSAARAALDMMHSYQASIYGSSWGIYASERLDEMSDEECQQALETAVEPFMEKRPFDASLFDEVFLWQEATPRLLLVLAVLVLTVLVGAIL